ncbi:hypothetical protein DH2020_035057 [Rehmannia glutinosa]|uniref:Uncharacterized protein n=1 Tax=Rehmannia glutinosa TaxID=99300 RepID=A0ABR0V885_REHGL
MSPLIASLIPSTPAAPPSAQPPLKSPYPHRSSAEINTISRRNAAVLLSSIIIPLLQPPLASAFSIGISGPKEWLKEQKKKSAKFLLAPVDASRNILQSAYLLLMKSEAEFGENDMEEVQKLLVSAARDCVPQDRNSFVELQANTGVEVCTFRLLVKNASSLLDDRDPIKFEAEAKLDDLIRFVSFGNGSSLLLLLDTLNHVTTHSMGEMGTACEQMVLADPLANVFLANCRSFSSLNGMARERGIQLTSNSRQKVADALKDTISSLNDFEQGIKDCLQV